jgi:hypothetical protein
MVFVSQFVLKHGPAATLAAVDRVQPGVFVMLLQQVRELLLCGYELLVV